MNIPRTIFTLIIYCASFLFGAFAEAKTDEESPNVILILTDDQGIGDLGCHGNPWLKTPNIDAFYQQSVRVTDFHVSPYCTPTRGAIMTGRYPIHNGAWATFKGRDALSERAVTMADIFKMNGYRTAMFGKWHLGDNYPVRPTDCGFETVYQHHAGGVGELSDHWGNSYFDDVYYVNNEPKPFEGYCTDVWFQEAMNYIDSHQDEPFFVYLPTNAPHDPLIVAEEYAEPYKHLEGKEIIDANLYGMIANIDENFGKFYQFLESKGLLENTILIFMTDNGTRFGYSPDGKFGYNNGYEGIKGSKLEGGHRVPFFIHWKKGKMVGGHDIDITAAHVDLIPTLATLCDLNLPQPLKLDGVDLAPVLLRQKNTLETRSVFVHNRQDWRHPKAVDETCIIDGKWRLLNGEKLYDVETDPKQRIDLSDQFPEIVSRLLAENETFIAAAKRNPEYAELPVAVIGHPAQKEIHLTIQHAIGEDGPIWKPEQIAAGMKNRNNLHALEVATAGTYIIECRRWPKECHGDIWGIPAENPKNLFHYQTIHPEKARIQIANQMWEKAVNEGDEAVVFEVNLPAGKTLLSNDFIEGNNTYGVYYTYIRKQ